MHVKLVSISITVTKGRLVVIAAQSCTGFIAPVASTGLKIEFAGQNYTGYFNYMYSRSLSLVFQGKSKNAVALCQCRTIKAVSLA